MSQLPHPPTAFPEYRQMDLSGIAEQILAFWEQEKVFQQSVESRPQDRPFVFYEGPPSANGMPGIHHVMSRTIKDLFCRFKTLQGYRVERRAGWDTHGLPVELGVEKKMGITKADIGTKVTVAEYNQWCKEDVMKFTDVWNDLTKKMGYWVDLEHPYVTYEAAYIESLWALLKMLYNKNLLYEGYTIQPYSPAAGTGLSSHELNQPGCYRNVKDVSAVALFKAIPESLPDSWKHLPVHFMAWTTTPWTLPSNTALAVGADITYVLIDTLNPYSGQPLSVILAEELLHKYFNQELEGADAAAFVAGKTLPWRLVSKTRGEALSGIRYEQLLPYAKPQDGDAFRVITGDFVTTSDGTGIVHIAPSFGADDFKAAKQHGIGSLTLVDRQGKFTEEVQDELFPLAGAFVKEAYYQDAEKEAAFQVQKEVLKTHGIIAELRNFLSADELIVLKLKRENKLFKSEKYEHNYPHCWRTDKPVIYFPLDSWFIRTTAIKERLIELNKTINWKPAHTGEGRFGQWLENLVDWNLSRSRYWGTPLPIWKTEDGAEEICIGSVEELRKGMEASVKAGWMKAVLPLDDLHKPLVDEIVLVSPGGKPMKRVSDLIDVWFDSGAMPYAQWGFPIANRDRFERAFPADFIAEGVDQTRGWFFTLHVLGVALFDQVAYKNVVSNGLMLDKNGNKMSKRLGNVIDPFETIKNHSADATRWYMIRNSDPWENMKFDPAGVTEVSRSQFGTVYNTYSFLALYANLDRWMFGGAYQTRVEDRPEQDRWIISRLHSTLRKATEAFEAYEPTTACRIIEHFTDNDLSNWYVRLNRRRFWKGEMSNDKIAAYETLHECLVLIAQLMAPVAPFFSDWLYRNLQSGNPEAAISVHLSLLPKADGSKVDEALEERMLLAQRACSLLLSLRKKEKIKVRQPLAKTLIPVNSEAQEKQFRLIENYILSEVNVKSISYISGQDGIARKSIKLNFRELGKKAGAKMKAIQQASSLLTQSDISRLEQEGKFLLSWENDSFELLLSDVEIVHEDIPGWLVASEGSLTVALDIHISPELRNEGHARELINRIQNLRKDKGFQVLDRIVIHLEKNDTLQPAFEAFKDYICAEVLANSITYSEMPENSELLDINDIALRASIALA